jgi:hypothetical protein
MTVLATPATFPFCRDQTYTFGELRSFEKHLLAARQSDPALSKEWRVPSASAAVRLAKIREETYPLMLLADLKAYPNSSTFRLTPDGTPAIDAIVCNGSDSFQVQITIADPIWLDSTGQPSKGGYDHRLTMEALNKDGVVHGLAAMRRENDGIVSDKPVKSFSEEFDACVRGMVGALNRKISDVSVNARLLVHARGYSMHVIDFSLEEAVRAAIQQIGPAKVDGAYSAYYFVDEGERCFLEYAGAGVR